jgi:uncharacterized protein YcaQ
LNTSKILSLEQAQSLALSHQGLLNPVSEKSRTSTLQTIENLGYVQIDTLAVIARAHHHTLWSRQPRYKENELNQLLEQKQIFEYWSHAASYLPMSDYRFSLPQKKAYESGKSHWFSQDKKMKKFVLDRIKAEGALQSKDFEFKREGPGNWYEWKPAKRALEQLFMEGRLMVEKRQGFQKVYNLTERILPSGTSTLVPTEKEMAEYLIRKAIQAHGIVTESEITYLRNPFKTAVSKALKYFLKSGALSEVKIEGLEKPYYIDAVNTLNVKSNKGSIHFLSPFDNLVIQRKRIQQLFGFDYMIECYLPESKRKYGYFTLPVLYNNGFVARFDPKADRATKTFYIKSLHFEDTFKPSDAFNQSFALKLKQFAAFNGCDKIVIEKAGTRWKKNINAAIKAL